MYLNNKLKYKRWFDCINGLVSASISLNHFIWFSSEPERNIFDASYLKNILWETSFSFNFKKLRPGFNLNLVIQRDSALWRYE